MPCIKGISHKILTRRVMKEARKIPIEKRDYIGPGDGAGREELGRCYPGKLVLLVRGMARHVEGETVTHELIHNRGGIIGRNERRTERAGKIAYEGMSRKQRAELRRRVPED